MTRTLALVLLAACGTNTGEYTVRWAPGVNDHGYQAICTTVVSHPCPFLTYTTRFHDDGTHFVWDMATGGTDEAGVAAENRAPWLDAASYDADGGLVLAARGDDGGLRLAATLTPTADGWGGTISWDLFTVAGRTDFAVTVSQR